MPAIRYIWGATVVDIKEHEPIVRGHKVNGDAVFEREKRGWMLILDNNLTLAFVDRPEVEKGQKVKLMIEIPTQAPVTPLKPPPGTG